VVLFTWLRFMATRQLVWNKNYNVKPREISAAQNGLTATLCRHVLHCVVFTAS
jgi:alpha-glucan,water dikinase